MPGAVVRVFALIGLGLLSGVGLWVIASTANSAESSDAGVGCDLELGAQVFQLCSTCHALEADDRPREGPSLRGVFGSKAATVDRTFEYSPALRESQWLWDRATLESFVGNPRRALPGTTMTFIGIKSIEERAAVACYLERAIKR